jgi:F0F1-type ATP synthase assembly protein I
MSAVFGFFLRLFLCFVAARFLLQSIGVEGRDFLVGLTIVLLANVYLFGYLVFRERRRTPAEAERQPPQGPA